MKSYCICLLWLISLSMSSRAICVVAHCRISNLFKGWTLPYFPHLCLFLFKRRERVLVGWLDWLDHGPVHPKVVGLIPSQGTPRSQVPSSVGAHMWGNRSIFLFHINVSLSLSLSLSASLSPAEISKQILRWEFKKGRGRGIKRSRGKKKEMEETLLFIHF